MPVVQPREIQVWLARPDEVGDGQWPDLEHLLDPQEQARAARFKLPADRRAYVLTHALRRRVLSQALGVAPSALVFADAPGGKPVLIAPKAHGYFFSHSRSRGLVAFAITALQPIGIDVETVHEKVVDFDLLTRFIELADAPQRAAELGPDPTRQFFFYWTALEAFWKAQGTGLVSGNPRVRFARDDTGQFQLSCESDAAPVQARLVTVEQGPGHVIALALKQSRTTGPTMEQAAISLLAGSELFH